MADETRAEILDADRLLAARILAGDGEAFEALLHRAHRHVSRIAGRFFRRPEVVEEVVQEVFVKAFVGMSGYRAIVPFEHWLARITVNACYDQLRRRRARPEVTLADVAEDQTEFFERLAAPAGDEGFWRREEARLTAERLLAALAPPERLVLTLMVLEELSVKDVAALTGWSETNVKVRAFRARGKLRALLAGGAIRTRSLA